MSSLKIPEDPALTITAGPSIIQMARSTSSFTIITNPQGSFGTFKVPPSPGTPTMTVPYPPSFTTPASAMPSVPLPALTPLPTLDSLPFPGISPRHLPHLTNIQKALAHHSRSANYERLHDALFCFDYLLKLSPYSTEPRFVPVLECWMNYKDRFLSHEQALLNRGLILDEENYAYCRFMVLVGLIWPGWKHGILLDSEIPKAPGGERVSGDALYRTAMLNMNFPMDSMAGSPVRPTRQGHDRNRIWP